MTTPTAAAAGARPKLDVVVDKPTPYTFDLGLLLANDPNPFDSSSPAGDASAPLEDRLSAAARDGAQALVRLHPLPPPLPPLSPFPHPSIQPAS